MTKPILLLLGAMSSLVCATGLRAESYTLDESFVLAKARSEQLADQQELIVQAQERYRQAIAAIYPTLNGVVSYVKQESAASGASGSDISPADQPTIKLTLTQPVFRGFREYAALRATKQQRSAQEEQKLEAERQLYKDLTQSYLNILAIETDLHNVDDELSLFGQRLKELQGRVRVGRSRSSEVLTVEVAMINLQAEVSRRQGELAANREAYSFLTGLPANSVLADFTSELPEDSVPLDKYLSRIDQRADIKVAQAQHAAAEENVAVARGAYFPSIDAIGNYYFLRSGFSEDITWDVNLILTQPLFAGGGNVSKVRQARSQLRQSDVAVQLLRRRAEQEIKTLHSNLQAGLKQLRDLKRVRKTAEENYQQENRDYRLGLVNNLEVLQALTTFRESQRALDNARSKAFSDFVQLELAAAMRPKE